MTFPDLISSKAEPGRHSEADYEAIFNAANDAIFVHDIQTGRILAVNQRMSEMYGFSVEDAKRLKVGDLSSSEPPYTNEHATERLQQAAAGEPQLFEWLAKDKSGRLFWVEVNLKRAFLWGRDVLLAVVRDISIRKKLLAELRQSEERFQKAFTANPQPMSLTTLEDGRYVDVNECFLSLSGYTRDEVIGHTSSELNIWSTPSERAEFIARFSESDSIKNVETGFRMKNGTIRVLLSSAEQLTIGGEKCLLVASSDITERKLAEDKARLAMEELKLIADSVPALVAHIDTNCIYRFNNLAYEEWFGKPRSEITGRHMRDTLGDELWQKVQPMIEQALAGKEVHSEHVASYGDNPPRYVSVTQTPIRDARGQVTGVVSLVSDITEIRRAEESLRNFSGKLIQAQEEERSRVARELHDDLSQRVALLAIELEYVARHSTMSETELNQRMLDLFEDAREISSEIHRISHQLHPSKLDRLGLAKAVKSFSEEFAAHHHIQIQLSTAGFPCQLPKEVKLCAFRIVQESLRNVIKHSGATRAYVALDQSDGFLKVKISDNGRGFDNLSESMSGGLGFISMRERLRSVSGKLSVVSEPDGGTEIEASIPIQSQHTQVSSQRQEHQPSSALEKPLPLLNYTQEAV